MMMDRTEEERDRPFVAVICGIEHYAQVSAGLCVCVRECEYSRICVCLVRVHIRMRVRVRE